MKPTQAEKAANSGNWMQAVKLAWDSKSPAMDWAGMEATLRTFTKSWNDGAQVTAMDLSSILEAFTKRGPAI